MCFRCVHYYLHVLFSFSSNMDPRRSPLLMLERQRVLRYNELLARRSMLGPVYRNMRMYERSL